jgi:hypothetical protein
MSSFALPAARPHQSHSCAKAIRCSCWCPQVGQPALGEHEHLTGRLFVAGALLHPGGDGEAQEPFRDRRKLLRPAAAITHSVDAWAAVRRRSIANGASPQIDTATVNAGRHSRYRLVADGITCAVAAKLEGRP